VALFYSIPGVIGNVIPHTARLWQDAGSRNIELFWESERTGARVRVAISTFFLLATTCLLLAINYKVGPFEGSLSERIGLAVSAASFVGALAAPARWLKEWPNRSWRDRAASPERLENMRSLMLETSRRTIEAEVQHRDLDEALPGLYWPFRQGKSSRISLEDLVALFDGPDDVRLLITGDAGAGKSSLALLLAQQLLPARSGSAEGRVPVIFNVSTWDHQQIRFFEDWLVQRVLEDCKLRKAGRCGLDAARRLITDAWILPFLDGLDELPAAAEAHVLDYAAGQGRIILTRRSHKRIKEIAREFDLQTVKMTDVPLPQALTSLARYDAAWDKVLQHSIQGDPLKPLSEALQTPLMIFLAREVCRGRGEDPLGLARPGRFRNSAEVKDYLLSQFVPTVYRRNQKLVTGTSRARRYTRPPRTKAWPQKRATDWLRFIAAHATDHKSGNIQWWDLWSSAPQQNRVFPIASLVLPIIASLIANLAAKGTQVPSIWSLITVLCIGVNGYMVMSRWRFALTFSLRAPIQHQPALDMSFGCGTLAAVIGGYEINRIAGLAAGLAAAPVIIGAAMWASRLAERRPNEGQITTDPTRQMRHLRTTAVAGAVCFAAAIAVALSWWLGPSPDIAAPAIAAGLIPLRMSAWSTFLSARVETALTRQLPWRYMKFLNDAATLGVLRRSGPAYQFRHDRIRSKLIDQAAERERAVAKTAEGSRPSASGRAAKSKRKANTPRVRRAVL
jgi:hypothetical protein